MSHVEPIHSRLADDPILGEIVAIFVEEMPSRITSLQDHLAKSDWNELGRTAHQLKGALGSHGFDELSPAAKQLEDAVRNNEPVEAIRSKAEELISMCDRITATPAGADASEALR